MFSPKLTVIMAVHNGARYLRSAIESILDQTFKDFELIIIDDGSTDDTRNILTSYADARIKIIENDNNIGLTKSLNLGIRASNSELIARQDADDFSLPERLAHQVALLNSYPEIGLIGAGSRWINDRDEIIKEWRPESNPVLVQQLLLSSIPFLHGTFLFRRSCLKDAGGGYDETKPVAQDCDLLFRISERWEVANLPEILYIHRRHYNTITAKQKYDQERFLEIAQMEAISRRFNYGWGKLGIKDVKIPDWVKRADRSWLAKRYVWWSAATRDLGKVIAFQFLVIALLLDPPSHEIWSYIQGILKRKTQKYISFH